MSVFIDTSAFLAIANAGDERHENAVREWRKLLDSGELLITTNYTVVEAASLLQSRHGVGVLRLFADSVLDVVLIEWVDVDTHKCAIRAVLTSSGRRGPGMVDCVSFEIIRRSAIDKVFAYDKHFEGRGFELVGE